MFDATIRSRLILGTLMLSCLGAAPARASQIGSSVLLVDDSDPSAVNPVPHCSKCRVKVVTDAEDGAVLEIDYDDEHGDFVGFIVVTALLTNGEYQHVVLDDVDLVCGEISDYELDPQTGWSWDGAQRVMIEFRYVG